LSDFPPKFTSFFLEVLPSKKLISVHRRNLLRTRLHQTPQNELLKKAAGAAIRLPSAALVLSLALTPAARPVFRRRMRHRQQLVTSQMELQQSYLTSHKKRTKPLDDWIRLDAVGLSCDCHHHNDACRHEAKLKQIVVVKLLKLHPFQFRSGKISLL
jgi:hypothetical protein